MLKKQVDAAFSFVTSKLFSEKTFLLYDHILCGREADFPTPEEIRQGDPNPCGYSTGMEDGMINGATMMDACLLRYQTEKDTSAAALAAKLVKGMLSTAGSGKDGFLPRAVCPLDGKSHYTDSSRDQYTMFLFAMHRFLHSELCTPAIKKEITTAALSIAKRAEKNVTKENRYDLLTEDGRPTLVTTMWGDTLGNHEYMRLPMIYLFAYECTKEMHWLAKYREIRGKAFEKSLPMTRYWALYTLQQMQASLFVCLEADPDEGWREKYLSLMHTVADYAEAQAGEIRQKIEKISDYNPPLPSFRTLPSEPAERFIKLGYPAARTLIRADGREFFAFQDGAQIAIIAGMVPGRAVKKDTVHLLAFAFSKIDLTIHERNLPLFFLDGYYRSLA